MGRGAGFCWRLGPHFSHFWPFFLWLAPVILSTTTFPPPYFQHPVSSFPVFCVTFLHSHFSPVSQLIFFRPLTCIFPITILLFSDRCPIFFRLYLFFFHTPSSPVSNLLLCPFFFFINPLFLPAPSFIFQISVSPVLLSPVCHSVLSSPTFLNCSFPLFLSHLSPVFLSCTFIGCLFHIFSALNCPIIFRLRPVVQSIFYFLPFCPVLPFVAALSAFSVDCLTLLPSFPICLFSNVSSSFRLASCLCSSQLAPLVSPPCVSFSGSYRAPIHPAPRLLR